MKTVEAHIPYLLAAAWFAFILCGALFLSSKIRPRSRKTAEVHAESESWSYTPGHRLLILIATTVIAGILFIYPALTEFRHRIESDDKVKLLVSILIFLGLIGVALLHAWSKGDMDWKNGDTGEGSSQ